jgi:hypothetical protein
MRIGARSPQWGIASLKIQQIRCLAQFRAGIEHGPASAVGLEAAGAVPGPPVQQTARSEQSTVLKSRYAAQKSSNAYFTFAFSPSSTERLRSFPL